MLARVPLGPQRVDERLREEALELTLARTRVEMPCLVIQPLNDSEELRG